MRQHKTSGEVRDVALDRVEAQMEAANQPQMVGILAQGGVRSQFGDGDDAYGLDAPTYARNVLATAKRAGAWKVAPSLGRTILSAHSGGAHTVRRALASELDDKKQAKGPSAFAEVALFDAITGPGELKVFTDWVLARLNADHAVLTDPARKDVDKAAYLKTSTRFRGYYASYKASYEKLEGSICGWFGTHADELGPYAAELWTHYQVIDTKLGGGGHEYVMRGSKPSDKGPAGKGNIADVIGALNNPIAARPLSDACGIGNKPAGRATPARSGRKSGAQPAEGDRTPVAASTSDRITAVVGKPTSMVVAWLLHSMSVFGGESVAVGEIARAGFTDPVDITDLVFGVRHPELGGDPIPRGRDELVEEWRTIRHSIVEPALGVTKAKKDAAAQVAPTAGAVASTPSAPAATTGRPATTSAPVPATGTTPTGDFITSLDRTTFELLTDDQRTRFEAIPWVDLDYPDAQMKVEDTSEANLNKWRADPNHILFPLTDKKKQQHWYIKGAHQADAQALLDALGRVRPGGGERRANQGPAGILTKKQFKEDPVAYDAYIESQLEVVKGQTSRMNKHAAAKFVEMAEAAKTDGVVLKIGNAFRERKVAEASAAKRKNPKAVASYSSHSLGLAMDLNLRTKAMGKSKTTSTAMRNVVDLLRAPAYKWMFMRGAEFGFYQFRMEPWHWEYNPKGFRDTFWAEMPSLRPEEEVEVPKASEETEETEGNVAKLIPRERTRTDPGPRTS